MRERKKEGERERKRKSEGTKAEDTDTIMLISSNVLFNAVSHLLRRCAQHGVHHAVPRRVRALLGIAERDLEQRPRRSAGVVVVGNLTRYSKMKTKQGPK